MTQSLSKTQREILLMDAAETISQKRNLEYGEPEDNFSRCAQMMDAYLKGKDGGFEPHDVAAFGIILKLSRIANDPTKYDSWLDLAGYAALGFEVTKKGDPAKDRLFELLKDEC